MANAVSDALKRAIYADHTERVFIMLLEIDHARLIEPQRLTTDGQDTVHDGKTFLSVPFKVTLPDDRERALPTAQITLPNLDLTIIELIRKIDSPADVWMVLVLDSDPDAIERGPWKLKLRDVDYDVETVRGNIGPTSLLAEPFPAYVFNTLDYRAL